MPLGRTFDRGTRGAGWGPLRGLRLRAAGAQAGSGARDRSGGDPCPFALAGGRADSGARTAPGRDRRDDRRVLTRTLIPVTTPAGASTAKGRARRQQLLATALRVFGVHGYRGTSLASIAAEAGISEAGLLHYFPSKPELLLATLEHYEIAAGKAARLATASNGSHAELLLRLAADHERDPQFIRLLLVVGSESTDADHPGHEWMAQRYERTRQHAERQFAADQGANLLRPQVDTAQLAALMVAVMDGLELQFLLSGGARKIVAPLRAFFAPYYR